MTRSVDVAELLAMLRSRGETVAVAESLTGGLLAAAFVEVPGASSVFRGGLVVYAMDLKASLAGVPQVLLDEHGPVDPDVAVALATGARERCQADWGLSTTGVAGPEPQGGQPVGRLYVAVAGPVGGGTVGGGRVGGGRVGGGTVGGGLVGGGTGGGGLVRRFDGTGDRATIRRFAVDEALALFANALHAADAHHAAGTTA